MTEGLKNLVRQVRTLTGSEKVYIFPPPYKKGHFSVQGDVDIAENCGFVSVRDGKTTRLTATPETLLSALEDTVGEEKFAVEPSLSPLHTLVFQILRHFVDGFAADEPELMRLALDLEEESPRTKVVYDRICRTLPERYAAALREGRQKSCLSLIARRMIETNWVKSDLEDTDMKIEWLGHSSFRISGSKTLVTDPYDGIGLTFPAVSADIVTVSHGHHDHNAVEKVKGEPAVVQDAGEHRIGDVTITGYNTYHDDCKGEKRGRNVVYRIVMDGITVVHLGDLGCTPNHAVMNALENADILLIPVGGNYTIDGEAAVKLVQQLKPRCVIPMHYSTKGLTVNVAGKEDFLKAVGQYETVLGSSVAVTPLMPRVLVFEKPLGED